MSSCSVSASCHSARAVLCRPIFDCLSFEIQIGLYWPVGSEGPSNVEKQIQENSNYFVILSSRMKPKSTKIIWKDYENNVTYRVQLFEKIFILWDNSSSITVQFGEYCCQSKMYKSGICGFSPFIETVRCTYSSCACSCLRISSRIFFCEFLANRMSSPILGLSTLK